MTARSSRSDNPIRPCNRGTLERVSDVPPYNPSAVLTARHELQGGRPSGNRRGPNGNFCQSASRPEREVSTSCGTMRGTSSPALSAKDPYQCVPSRPRQDRTCQELPGTP